MHLGGSGDNQSGAVGMQGKLDGNLGPNHKRNVQRDWL